MTASAVSAGSWTKHWGQLLKLAATLATLMFMPLLNALIAGPSWLHWGWIDSIATVTAHLLTTSVIAASIWWASREPRPFWTDVVCAVWFAIALMLALGGVAKLGALSEWLALWRGASSWILVLMGGAVTLALVACVLRPGARPHSRVQRAIGLFWPLSALLALHLVRAPWLMDEIDAEPGVAAPLASALRDVNTPRTVILLFDEWSPDLLYGANAPDLGNWPAISNLVSSSHLYLDAHLAGGETAKAIPNLVGLRQSNHHNLFDQWAKGGSSIRVWGWYHDYCRELAQAAQACRSISIYNTRTLKGGAWPVNPWRTNLNLLPAEGPFRLMKEPSAVAFHRETLQGLSVWLTQQLSDTSADLIYAHVNVPHLPLITENLAPGERPFKMTPIGYLSQYESIDNILAQVAQHQERPTRIVILSDHNARHLVPRSDHDHVVLMIREPAQDKAVSVKSRTDAAALIHQLVPQH